MDFNAELTKHLTLKKQKQQQQPQVNATEANLRTNRGPPPQPPTQKNITSVSSWGHNNKNIKFYVSTVQLLIKRNFRLRSVHFIRAEMRQLSKRNTSWVLNR